jgi:hypothetical protein
MSATPPQHGRSRPTDRHAILATCLPVARAPKLFVAHGRHRTMPVPGRTDDSRPEPRALNTYARWIGARQVPTLGTNAGAPTLAFQGWHRFKEAFPPEVVERAIRESSVSVERSLDVFGGSGTTALTSQMLGIASTTVEVNPFLADLIRAKLEHYDVDELARSIVAVRSKSRRSAPDPSVFFADVPATFLEPGVDGRWLFGRQAATRLGAILCAIDELESAEHRRLLRVIVGGLLVDASNAVVSGKGRRYRRNWEERERRRSADAIDELFYARARAAMLDIRRFGRRSRVDTSVIEGDARLFAVEDRHQVAVLSPPYPNSFDYTDVYNVELWMLRYLTDTAGNRRLRRSTLTSHVQLLRDYPPAPRESKTLSAVLAELDASRERLWSRWIPSMVGGYFADLLTVLDRVREHLDIQGTCWLVVGDSRYAGIHIPVAQVIQELAPSQGWSVLSVEPCRAMRTSAQQGGESVLAETLVVLGVTSQAT